MSGRDLTARERAAGLLATLRTLGFRVPPGVDRAQLAEQQQAVLDQAETVCRAALGTPREHEHEPGDDAIQTVLRLIELRRRGLPVVRRQTPAAR